MAICLFVCLSVCLLSMAGRTAGPIKTKLGMGTHVDPGSVLVLTEARKGLENSSAKRDKSPAEGRVLTASILY